MSWREGGKNYVDDGTNVGSAWIHNVFFQIGCALV
jgi:hypothetical protein